MCPDLELRSCQAEFDGDPRTYKQRSSSDREAQKFGLEMIRKEAKNRIAAYNAISRKIKDTQNDTTGTLGVKAIWILFFP